MPHAAAGARDEQGAPLLSIGQVLARLSPEFPDVTPSKLRFLEDQGLVSPARTPSGYRKFSAEDVSRLRTVLGLQRDQYLPLKVIRSYLDDLDAGVTPMPPDGPSRPSMLATGRRLDRAALLAESGASAALLDEAVQVALITPADVYGDDALTVLTALVELRRSGIEPRHLRGIRAAAEREVGLIESALAPVLRRHQPGGRARSTELTHELAGRFELIRGTLVRAGLDRLNR